MGRCQSLRTAVTPTTYDKASCDRIKRYQPSAVSAHFAPNTNNGCDQVPPIAVAEQSERWAYNSQAAHAADGDRRGWASDFNLGWPERPAGDQEPCPARAPPYAAVSSRADRAYMAGAYTEKIQQDPPQGCLWPATPRGGAQSTWQLEPEHRTSAFDPPPKRLRAEESRSLRQIQQQMQHERQELHDELPNQRQHLLLPHLRQVRQYAQQLEERPSPHCQRSPQQQGHVHNPILPQCEEVQDLHRHGWPSHGREQRHDGSSWRRMGSTGRAGLP